MNTIKKSTIALLAAAVMGTTATPMLAEAKNFNFVSIKHGINSLFVRAEAGENNVVINGTNILLGNNSDLRDARKVYNKAIQDANKAYRDAKKAAREKLNSALVSAGNDFAKRLAAYRVYMADMLAAQKQKNDAKEAAMQKYIDALSGIQTTNQAPTANSQSVTTNEETAKAITLTGSDSENTALTYTVVQNPTHGTLSGTVPNLTYTPDTNYSGSDSFTFRVNDGTQNSNTATVSITVTNVNDAPVATAQSVTTAKNTSKTITLAGTDVEGSTLSYYVVTNPTHGTLSGTVPNLTYLPATDYTGSDSFTFKVNDGTVDSATATVSITVNP